VALTATTPVASQIFSAVEIEIPTEAGGTYLVQRSFDLQTWSPFSDPIAGTGLRVSMFFPTRPNAHTFYRVRQRLNQPETLQSLNGIKISFVITNPAGRPGFETSFSGAIGAQSGSYNAVGGTQDAGTYTYSTTGTQGTLTVFSSIFLGSQAKYILDFSNSTYTKSQNGQMIESGSFSY